MAKDNSRFEIALLSEEPEENVRSKNIKEEEKIWAQIEKHKRLQLQSKVWIIATVLLVIWIIFVIVVIILSGIGILNYHPSVLVTLLGSATVYLIGLFMKIVSYVFPDSRL